jgi:hypothetical protein
MRLHPYRGNTPCKAGGGIFACPVACFGMTRDEATTLWDGNGRMTLNQLCKLAEGLGCSVGYLVTGFHAWAPKRNQRTAERTLGEALRDEYRTLLEAPAGGKPAKY